MQPHAFLPRLLLWLLVPLLLVALTPAARADTCENCPVPKGTDFLKQIDGGIKIRGGFPDRIYTDKGDCIAGMEGAPVVQPVKYWLRKVASGEVWNCPHSKSHDTIIVEAHHADKTEWTLQATGGFKLKALVAEVQAEITKGNTTGVTITEVVKVSKTIVPTWCKRIEWAGYFLAGQFKATGTMRIKQQWAWWTKNPSTGYKVHEKGMLVVDCGTAEIEFRRNAPLAGYFELTERSCEDSTCGGAVEKHLGFFPKLPPEVEPPGRPTTPTPEPEQAGQPEPEAPPEPPSETEPESSGELGDPPAGPVEDPLEEPPLEGPPDEEHS